MKRFCAVMGVAMLASCSSSHQDPKWAEDAARLHGNMGPGVIVGAMVGHDAMNQLGDPKPWEVEVALWLPADRQIPGYRCILDGLQSTTGATMGKGNIVLKTTPAGGDRRPRIVITEGEKRLTYLLNEKATSIIDQTNYPTMRADSHRLLDMSSAAFTRSEMKE
ncbi:MAG TPA: formylmethanofuran dehydrogenase subunit E family protein [Tepidisphaeraceae bacterium]|jgi:hypothetical protein|nr:formylmethanofuran dehydrogenase subunit E family protein [Tepidisphaeraceae bacterium]